MIKILILNDRGMGDCIIGTMAAQVISHKLSDCELYFAVSRKHYSLFQSRYFQANKQWHFLPADYRRTEHIWSFYKELRSIQPDYVVEISPTRRVGKVMKVINWIPGNGWHFCTSKGKEAATLKDGSPVDALQNAVNDIATALSIDNFAIEQSVEFVPVPDLGLSAQRSTIIMSMASSARQKMVSLEFFRTMVLFVREHYPNKEVICPYGPSTIDIAFAGRHCLPRRPHRRLEY